MAFATSYVNGYHLSQALINAAAYNLDTDTIRVSLYTDSITSQDKNANELKGSSPYTSNEVSYSGASPAAAQTLTNTSISTPAAGKFIFQDSASTCVWTTATFTARGAVIWDDTLTSPADPVLAAINFGADVPVSGGTFTITWDATNKIFYATY